MLYMQLLGHSPATQKIKTGQKVPNLSENSLYITFRKKTIQKYGIFLSHSPLIKSLQQSIRFCEVSWAGGRVHLQPRNTMVRKGKYKASGAPVRQEQKRLSAQRYPHSISNHSTLLLHSLDSTDRIFQNSELVLDSISRQTKSIK